MSDIQYNHTLAILYLSGCISALWTMLHLIWKMYYIDIVNEYYSACAIMEDFTRITHAE